MRVLLGKFSILRSSEVGLGPLFFWFRVGVGLCKLCMHRPMEGWNKIAVSREGCGW